MAINNTLQDTVLRFILHLDKELPENKRGGFSNKLELYRLVELTGRRSNEFDGDLSKIVEPKNET